MVVSWSDSQITRASVDKPKTDPLFLQLSFPQPVSAVLQKTVQQPQPSTKKIVETPPKPTPKPKPKPKKAIQPKKKPPEPKTVRLKKKLPVSEKSAEVLAQQPTPPKAQPKSNLLEQYLAELLASIEKHKRYPSLARRKNIEGKVEVRFKLACNGQVTELDISGSHSLLRKAANKAIKAAQPFPEIPAETKCPLPIKYAMAYTLKN
jgi:protein TonB